MYQVEVSPAADRDLAKLGKRMTRDDFDRIRETVRALAHEPRPHGVRKLKGMEFAYRVRVGDYRIIYDVYDADKKLIIVHIIRRNEHTYT